MIESATYRHTQTGSMILILLVAALVGVFVAVVAMGIPETIILAVTVAVLLLVGWLFGSLTVTIERGAINWWFGPGFWKNSVAIDEIEICEPVRNRWWWGWGIRYYGKGWLYNVSGMDAVEIRLKSGQHIRIGTSEPEMLVGAIRHHLEQRTDA
jgi:hypothetical protein